MTLAQQLAQGAALLGVTLPEATQKKMLDYEAPRMVSQHLLDCLAVVPHVSAATILDVGSGAGLPGIPLALALPESRVTLLEANHKKAAFLKQARIELKLGNVEIVCERVEAWRPDRQYEIVISRAFSDLAEFVKLAGRHVVPGGRLAAMKGIYPHEEIAQLPQGWRLQQAVELTVPMLRAQRHLLLLTQG
jgi:16S rRNA (guanine527-N7)-methyltransferase